MPTFAANLTMMFTEHGFMDRFAAAARCGFKAVEYLFPYPYEPGALAEKLREHGLKQALFNLPPGNWEEGERGMACLPGRDEEFVAAVEKGIQYAKALGNTRVHAMAGMTPTGVPYDVLESTYKQNISVAARMLAPHGLTLCIEPINQRSMPGYFLRTQGQAVQYINDMGQPNIKLQFDVFHVQMEEGCVALKWKEFLPHIGHCQIAGVPERHEPDTGELNYDYIFSMMDKSGYQGFVGCEYNPAGDTAAGLGWLKKYL